VKERVVGPLDVQSLCVFPLKFSYMSSQSIVKSPSPKAKLLPKSTDQMPEQMLHTHAYCV